MTATQTEVTLKPLGDRVVLELVESSDQTPGGIYLPDTAKDKPQAGIILFVGPGRRNDKGELEAMTVQVGNKVLFAKYAGTDVKLGGKEVKILSEKDILGILEG
jgi:chaperonin GroES